MYSPLNPSGYKYSATFYDKNFEEILSKIIFCYNLMIANNIRLDADENEIRNAILRDYLNNNLIRKHIGLTYFLFDPEVPEGDSGRTDIKIQTKNTFEDTAAYYVIECKLLDSQNSNGVSGLNGKYIKDGLCRYVSGKYSTYYRTNGMIGFVVQPMDIHANVLCINTLLANTKLPTNTRQHLQCIKLVDDFDYSYCSTHSIGSQNVTIYHLMLDFSSNIIQR
jgi:hypothetical protein